MASSSTPQPRRTTFAEPAERPQHSGSRSSSIVVRPRTPFPMVKRQESFQTGFDSGYGRGDGEGSAGEEADIRAEAEERLELGENVANESRRMISDAEALMAVEIGAEEEEEEEEEEEKEKDNADDYDDDDDDDDDTVVNLDTRCQAKEDQDDEDLKNALLPSLTLSSDETSDKKESFQVDMGICTQTLPLLRNNLAFEGPVLIMPGLSIAVEELTLYEDGTLAIDHRLSSKIRSLLSYDNMLPDAEKANKKRKDSGYCSNTERTKSTTRNGDSGRKAQAHCEEKEHKLQASSHSSMGRVFQPACESSSNKERKGKRKRECQLPSLPRITRSGHDFTAMCAPDCAEYHARFEIPETVLHRSDLKYRSPIVLEPAAAAEYLASAVLWISRDDAVLADPSNLTSVLGKDDLDLLSPRSADCYMPAPSVDLVRRHLRSGQWVWVTEPGEFSALGEDWGPDGYGEHARDVNAQIDLTWTAVLAESRRCFFAGSLDFDAMVHYCHGRIPVPEERVDWQAISLRSRIEQHKRLYDDFRSAIDRGVVSASLKRDLEKLSYFSTGGDVGPLVRQASKKQAEKAVKEEKFLARSAIREQSSVLKRVVAFVKHPVDQYSDRRTSGKRELEKLRRLRFPELYAPASTAKSSTSKSDTNRDGNEEDLPSPPPDWIVSRNSVLQEQEMEGLERLKPGRDAFWNRAYNRKALRFQKGKMKAVDLATSCPSPRIRPRSSNLASHRTLSSDPSYDSRYPSSQTSSIRRLSSEDEDGEDFNSWNRNLDEEAECWDPDHQSQPPPGTRAWLRYFEEFEKHAPSDLLLDMRSM
ncbi:hypothetical protein BP5796_03453 [Coleophoma crateriformis]|uniref:Uncharacterized protein n=1 Tax=Coleophoma crateriformis TaxID=565419 RepID=A0A3D8SN48_9HELO|nr:hypothetical protein BP5796_03453 [Coleophoma crateriformis]